MDPNHTQRYTTPGGSANGTEDLILKALFTPLSSQYLQPRAQSSAMTPLTPKDHPEHNATSSQMATTLPQTLPLAPMVNRSTLGAPRESETAATTVLGSRSTKLAPAAAPDSADHHHTPRKSRSFSISHASPTGKPNQDNTPVLSNVKVFYPLYEIPEELYRFIPESQLILIRPLTERDPLEKDAFIIKRKYATNVDDRTFLSVYEFQINDHWIIWDYHTGFVFFTGLWKAAGNTKTDIVKLVENIPSISSQVRRVRGGFLKIQGTWLPFDTCKTLAKNFAFPIRYCLVPIFGPEFPNECLKPGDDHYGKLVDLNAPPVAKPRRRSAAMGPRDATQMRVAKPMVKKRSYSDNLSSRRKNTGVPILEMEEVLKASKQLHDLSASSTGIRGMDGTVRERQLSFNYGGFVWSWKDENNLTILGKDEEAIIDEDDDASSVSGTVSMSRQDSFVWARQLQGLSLNPASPVDDTMKDADEVTSVGAGASTTTLNTTVTTPPPSQYTTTNIISTPNTIPADTAKMEDAIPKSLGGFDTILNAAQQLMTFSSSAHQSRASSSAESSIRETPQMKLKEKSPKMEIGGLIG